MKIDTNNFGEIEIFDEDIIDFPLGVIGFPMNRYFTILKIDIEEQGDIPIFCLQSIEDGNLAFILVDAVNQLESYNPITDVSQVEDLGELAEGGLQVYNIATIGEDLMDTTTNLKAPIVVNSLTKKAKQLVCNNDEYPIKHKLFDNQGALVTL